MTFTSSTQEFKVHPVNTDLKTKSIFYTSATKSWYAHSEMLTKHKHKSLVMILMLLSH